ncbi:hypothetical protein GCM10027429_18790 [Marivirga atlantica]|uniref:Gingipain domain-containing protein n=1 Tax=Marivirga atlantica TaxID=1548457 RepID=A0A937AEZ9_9BACT|nr:C25 family cysteine peptidase [Marivirga atlantica]MBL0765496.1 hypothetical protein [Marivirga atlantica]
MLKNRLFYFIFIITPLFSLKAQYGNEWINFNQTYYKIEVAQEGVYQLDFNSLNAAQINLNSIDARTFKMYHRGEEIALNVTGQSDGRINQGDVIQFLGKPNDGESDTPLYVEPDAQPHTYYNLFNDTTSYFLTWSLDGSFGKRMERINPISNSGGLPIQSSYLKTVRNLYVGADVAGSTYPPANEVLKSAFDYGEGWTGGFFIGERNIVLNNISKQVRTDDNLNFEILVQGRNNLLHEVEVFVGPNSTNLRSIGNTNFQKFEFDRISAELDWSDINSNGDLYVRIVSSASGNDRVSVSFLQLTYNKSFDMNNELNSRLELIGNSQGSVYTEFTNTNSTARLFRIDNFNDPQILETNRIGSTISTVVQNAANNVPIYVQNQSTISANLKKVSFRNLNSANPDYIIISNKLLDRPFGEYNNPVKAYSSYRATMAGGGYDTLTVFMDQLFNQFNYGETSPLAIYRFSRFLVENTKAEYVFLIGKGLNWFHKPYRVINDTTGYREYVPSAGYPGADNLYGYNILENNRPTLAYGRLNAHSPEIVANYLDKIIEMETQPIDNLRRKAFLHLSGGLSENEINEFSGYIDDFSSFARAPYIGGSAEEITKESTQVIESLNVSEQVNQGVNMITFFGHSETSSSDIDIGFVSNDDLGYQNQGKYPLIYINGCNAGSIYQIERNAITFGEDWVNTPNKGALHVMAHTALGLQNELKRYSDIFYAKAFGDSALIDEPIGKVHLETSKAYLEVFGNNPAELFIAQAQQFNLMGDPGYRLFPTNQPDFEITNNAIDLVSLNGLPIDATTAEFAFDLIIKNYGITTDDSLAITVNRRLPDNSLIPLDTQYYDSPYNQDTIRFFVENTSLGQFGESTFEFQLDPLDSISEMREDNNMASFNYFFSLGTTLNLYPYPFSIVNEADVTLTAQSIDLLSKERNYLFEIDTTPTFDSPFLKQETVTAKVIAKWSTSLLNNSNQSYYWRSKFAAIEEGEVDQWSTSSFIFNSALEKGWAQNKTDQFNAGEVSGLVIENSDWSYEENTIDLNVISPADSGAQRMSIRINSEEFSPYGFAVDQCAPQAVHLVAFDQFSGEPYRILNNGGFDRTDPFSCGRSPQVINEIPNSQLNNPTTYFQSYYDQLPAGDYVLMLSFDSAAWNVLRANNREEVLDLGASSAVFDNIENGNPYILFGRKGIGEGQGIESYSFDQPDNDPSKQLTISLNQTIDISFQSGSVTSTVVGPARSWKSVDANFDGVEASDDIRVDVFGIDTLNNQTLLFSDVSLPASIESVDASIYPQLRLRTVLTDSVELTPPRLVQWQVTYEELPDAVLLLNDEVPTTQPVLAEGEDYERTYSAVNVTPNSFTDSITYSQRIFNQTTRTEEINNFKLKALEAEETVNFSVGINTRGKVGVNNAAVILNSNNQSSEYRSVNNQISLNDLIDVKRDSLPPFIDVTFDGINILDGDIVSPSPIIKMVLKDENDFILRTDTSGLSLSIEQQCESCQRQPIYFSNPRVSFEAATDERPFTVTYNPEKFDDGTYTLRASAEDASGNSAGEEPFQVSFEVVNASTITNFYPYPNPFSTQTRFVFTLTGSEIPNEIKIQILTVSGRVVREILQDEIGMIHIGNNITEYAWDGRDQFGDKLANGVYLYRVLVRNNGNFMEQRATSADKAFKKGYGKLYILR